ncbi:MAG: glycosyl hydrolase family 18 protein [Peptococcaceae bacterium]
MRPKNALGIFVVAAVIFVLGASPLLAGNYLAQKEAVSRTGTNPENLAGRDDLTTAAVNSGQKAAEPATEEIAVKQPADNSAGINSGAEGKYVVGFYVDQENEQPSSYNSMLANKNEISAIAPFWYRLSPESAVSLEEHHAESGFTARQVKAIISKAQEEDIKVLMLIHNLLYSGQVNGKKLAQEMLAGEDNRKAFIANVEKILKEYNYDGINLDIESIYIDDRDNFSALLKEMFAKLAPQGYTITVSVPAKTCDDKTNAWSGPFDYGVIGKYADYIAVMTYDEHGYSSEVPGPIASQGWVEDVVKYAVKEIPAEKILVGIAGYGFDWQTGHKAPRYLSYSQALETAQDHNISISWDDRGKVPYFKYTDDDGQAHEVWFESGSSFSHKLEIVKSYDLGGIAVWRLGLEDQEMWNILRDNMKVIK